jgi:hypothetical protein
VLDEPARRDALLREIAEAHSKLDRSMDEWTAAQAELDDFLAEHTP